MEPVPPAEPKKPGTGNAQAFRQHGESSMEGFIKHHMTHILQPIMTRVNDMEAHLARLESHLERVDHGVENAHTGVLGAREEIAKVRRDLGQTDTSVDVLRRNLKQCTQAGDTLRDTVEMLSALVSRIQRDVQGTSHTVESLERGAEKMQVDLESMQTTFERSHDDTHGSISRNFEQLRVDVQSLRALQGNHGKDLEAIRSDHDEKATLLETTRQQLFKNGAQTSCLEKVLAEIKGKETEMGLQLEDVITHCSKLHLALVGVENDVTALKAQTDDQGVAVQGLQQNHAASTASFQSMQKSHDHISEEIVKLQKGAVDHQQHLSMTKEGLGRTVAFTNELFRNIQRTESEVCKAGVNIQSLASKQASMNRALEHASNYIGELTQQHQHSLTNVQSLQRELGKTKETLHTARAEMDATTNHLQGLKGEMARTNEAVSRLDNGIELCHATFSGLQKGLTETGSHVATRPLYLPKINSGASSVPLGDKGLASTASTRFNGKHDDALASTRASPDYPDHLQFSGDVSLQSLQSTMTEDVKRMSRSH